MGICYGGALSVSQLIEERAPPMLTSCIQVVRSFCVGSSHCCHVKSPPQFSYQKTVETENCVALSVKMFGSVRVF